MYSKIGSNRREETAPHPHLWGPIKLRTCLARDGTIVGRGSQKRKQHSFPGLWESPEHPWLQGQTARWALMHQRSLNPFCVKALEVQEEPEYSLPFMGHIYTCPRLFWFLSQIQRGQGHPLYQEGEAKAGPKFLKLLCLQLLTSRECIFIPAYF